MAFTNTSPLMVPTRAKKVNKIKKKKEKEYFPEGLPLTNVH